MKKLLTLLAMASLVIVGGCGRDADVVLTTAVDSAEIVTYDTVTLTVPDGTIKFLAEVDIPFRCPDGWECAPIPVIPPDTTPPVIPPDTIPPVDESIYVLRLDSVEAYTGMEIAQGTYYIDLTRRDGSWDDIGGNNAVAAPGVDSVLFFRDGDFLNRERLFPYTWRNGTGIGKFVPGTADLGYEVFGELPEDMVIGVIIPETTIPPDTTPPVIPPPVDTIPPVIPPVDIVVNECATPSPAWIWCDDFEENRLDSYFEHAQADGDFDRAADVGMEGSYGMKTIFRDDKMGRGWMHAAIGKTPQSRMRNVDGTDTIYREVYWRFLVRNQPGWTGGGGHKLTRARGFASPTTWQHSFEANLWSGNKLEPVDNPTIDKLVLDPVSGTDVEGNLLPYDGGSLGTPARWLGIGRGITHLFSDENVGPWYCVEAHVKLNDAGESNGVFEFWINGELESRREGLNWVGNFSEYGINAITLDNYWNGTPPQDQERYLDNLVVSTAPIGCDATIPPVIPPPVDTTPPPVDTIPPVIPPPTGEIGDTINAISYWFADPYGSQESFMADVKGSLGGTSHEGNDWVYASAGSDHMTLDGSEGYADLTKAVRFDYEYTTDECVDDLTGSGCKAQRWTFSLWNDNSSRHDPFIPYTEHWTEASFRNSDNTMGCSYNEAWGEKFLPFDGTWPRDDPDFRGMWTNPDPPCAHKFIQFNPGGTWPRLMFIPCSHGAGGPECDTTFDINPLAFEDIPRTTDSLTYCPIPGSNCYNHAITPVIYDGQWHRIRYHWQPSSTPDVLDGRFEMWLDDEKWADIPIATAADGWHARLALGANKDHGGVFPHTEWTKWSHAIVWVETPNWY